MSKIVEAKEKIAEAVVGGYMKIETGVVEGFEKVTDKCVEKLLAKEGESVEDAKKRLSGGAAGDTEIQKNKKAKKRGRGTPGP